jgi:pimeloyl-ACP methyl ester carboxylesterase
MASSVYDMPESFEWKDVPAFGGSGVRVKSIAIDRNLTGPRGSIEVAYYIDSVFYRGYRFHHGLLLLAMETYKGIRDELEAGPYFDPRSRIRRVIHTGHSAGGAIAGLMPLLLDDHYRHYIVDFGTPRYLSTSSDRYYYPYPRMRFQEIYDIIPCIPLRWRGPLPGYRHFGDAFFTTPTHEIIPQFPFRRPFVLAWKYLHSLATEGPVHEIISHHSMSNYLTTVVQSYPQEPSP